MDHRGTVLAAVASLLVLLPAGSAHAAGVDMEVAFDVGFVPDRVHGSTSAPIPGATTPDGRPAGVIGDNSLNVVGGSVGGNAALMFPDFGPGIPRMFFFGDAMVFLARKGDAHLNLYDTTAGAQDTTITLRRNFVVDLAFGGIFPFCSQPSCLDLRVFLGATFSHGTITTAVDESTIGGKKEEVSGSVFKPSAMFGTLLSLPISKHLRLQLGFLFRSLPTSSVAAASSTRTYTTTIDGGVETQLTAGIAIPFSL